ncbi:MAG: glycosyltransferase family 4 protein [Aphanocapsa sp. GSE-SYN-MK-11-07L]|jgi:glycosyltransferase involved in cell wall biosynthesis|nr:glycosyltransferase family 4 protein [Aphanocapsa sp. GSE-SYN-MK-11-07L]
MRILFINPIGDLGGAERVLLANLKALRQVCPDWQLCLLLCGGGSLTALAEELGVEVKVLPLPDRLSQSGDSGLKGQGKLTGTIRLVLRLAIALPAFFNYLIRLRQILRAIDPNLIHSNGIKTHILLSLASPANIPIIWHIHDYYGSRPLVAKLLSHLSGSAKLGIAISKSVATDAAAILPRLPLAVVYNTVDCDRFSPAGTESLSKPAEPPNLIRIGLVATFACWKGQTVFLAAAAQMMRKKPDPLVQFYVVGGPIYQTTGSQWSLTDLQTQAVQLGIQDKVDFLGFQTNVSQVYRGLEIVVHASTQPEPFGLSIVEGMACGKPVIVAQAGGAAELFTHNYDAYGVPPGDASALADAMQYLVDRPQARQAIGFQARQTVLKRFNSDRLGEPLLAIYQTILSARVKCSSIIN